MSQDWQRTREMPDFTRSGQAGASGGGLFWLVVVLALLGGLVLLSAFGAGPDPAPSAGSADSAADSAPAAATDGAPTGQTGAAVPD